jgi:hypothetical protein
MIDTFRDDEKNKTRLEWTKKCEHKGPHKVMSPTADRVNEIVFTKIPMGAE